MEVSPQPASTSSVACERDPPADLPAPLEKLLKSTDGNLDDAQRPQVRELLREFQDVFSCNGEIGHRTLVEHEIETGSSPPIKQPPRRTFESTLFREVLHLMGVRKTRTTPLHPQSDGAVERLIKTLQVQLSLFIDTSQSDWDLQVLTRPLDTPRR